MPTTCCYSNACIDFFNLSFALPQNRDSFEGLAVVAWYTGPAEISIKTVLSSCLLVIIVCN